MENLPVQVEITRVDTLTPRSTTNRRSDLLTLIINQLQSWIDKGNDIVFAVGESRKTIKRIVAKRGHTPDILKFQRLGPLETALICKQNTYAPGMIAEIGPVFTQFTTFDVNPGEECGDSGNREKKNPKKTRCPIAKKIKERTIF